MVRGQLNQTKSQIMLMEAKLNGLRKMKDKIERKNQRNHSQIQFLNHVKERARLDAVER